MKFRSPTDEPVQMSLTTGHTCVVGVDYTEVEPRFQREALARNCIPEGTEHIEVLTGGKESNTSELVLQAVRAMVSDALPEDFGGDGAVLATRISKRVGFTVTRKQRDDAWAIVSEE